MSQINAYPSRTLTNLLGIDAANNVGIGGQGALWGILSTSNTRVTASGTDLPANDSITWSISGNTTAVMAARGSQLTLSGSQNITAASGGHAIGSLGWINNNNTGYIDLALGVESRIQHNTTGTINNAILFDADLAALASGGTINSLYGVFCSLNGISGTIGQACGFYWPSLAGMSVTTSFAFYNAEANSAIVSLGQIIAASGAEVASAEHPGIVSNRYYFGLGSTTTPSPVALSANLIYLCPFLCPQRTTFTKIGCRVTTGASGKNVQLGIYKCLNGVATTKLVSTASQSVTTTGIIEVTISQVLEAGMYLLGVISDGTPTINWIVDPAAASCIGTTTDNGAESTPFTSQTFGTWPNAPTMGYAAVGAAFPQIWLRK